MSPELGIILMAATSKGKDGRKLGLGIDTGGTFTDAVIVDLDTKEVITKAKAPTNHQNLSLSIDQAVNNVMEAAGIDIGLIRLVGVSTTLATNSVLEGKGARVGLIGIGWEPKEGWELGADKERFIQGGHDLQGRTQQPLLDEEVEAAIQEMSEGIDALVVSSLFSVSNRSHEEMVRKKAEGKLDLPVVAGHELTGELGVKERTVTAVLNARLIPVLDSFLGDVKKTLERMGIEASLMVFKGDGSLMNLETAVKRPVETILSGPAASAMGGKKLAGLDDCMVIDVGGTSTDIALLDGGFPQISPEGAVIGDWRTRVRAVNMWTAAMGGDSGIMVDDRRNITFSPKRVIPLSIASSMFDGLLEKMKESQETEFLVMNQRNLKNPSRGEKEVFEFVEEHGPVRVREIKDGVSVVLVDRYVDSLLEKGRIIGIGLTPTDILHVTGDYMEGDVEAAAFGVERAREKAHMDEEEFCDTILNMVASSICREVVKKVMSDEVGINPDSEGSEDSEYLLDLISKGRLSDILSLDATLQNKIVGIGAPVHVYLPMIEERLGTEVIIPDDHEVGNAVGAVCSQVVEVIKVMIYPNMDHKFSVIAPSYGASQYSHIEQAIGSAKSIASRHVRERAEMAGAKDVKVKVTVNEKKSKGGVVVSGELTHWVEVIAKAVGQPTIV